MISQAKLLTFHLIKRTPRAPAIFLQGPVPSTPCCPESCRNHIEDLPKCALAAGNARRKYNMLHFPFMCQVYADLSGYSVISSFLSAPPVR